MTAVGALTASTVADTDHVACFNREGDERGWQDLLAAAARVAERVGHSRGRRWALNLEETFDFTAALLGCWAARKTPVVAPAPMLEGHAASLSFDGVIECANAATAARERIVFAKLEPTKARIAEIAPTAELVLYTSGSTGTPKEISRQVHNLEAELAVLESLWGATLGTARVFSTVSHRHVYGLLFSVLWPLLNRRPFATFRLEFPEQLADGGGSGQALVSSPALLKRIGHLRAGARAWRAVFSSGGLLPAEAAADATRVLGACPIEVLGSTETSGVAWRRQLEPDATAFTALPRVETRAASTDDCLEVRSPFSGQSSWLRMGDQVRFTGGGRFELLGRGDHLAKIEDKRVSLAEIERYLLESPWIKDVAAVALDDGARQYVGIVAQLTADGATALASRGRRSLSDALKTSLKSRIERVAVPRKFRYVEAVPVDAQGKRQRALLAQLFVIR
jgi:acyl-coenzyme A synthetase/AMP-(fatty) acid ligase